MASRKKNHGLDQFEHAALLAKSLHVFQPVEIGGEERPERSEDAPQAADAPPLITWGESEDEGHVQLVVTDSGKIKLIPKRRGYGGKSAFLDWVNFTVHELTAHTFNHQVVVNDQEMILYFSEKSEKIFGFGISSQNPAGRNFYKKSFVLGNDFGLVCHGGQRNTVLFMLNGQGLAAALPGWEKRLHDFLTKEAQQPRLTRVDVAHDDYDGSTYSVDQAKSEFESGLFNCGGRTPDCEQRGNWYRPNGKGRTFYVGHRINGKYARIYEKGKQLGDKDSAWCRIEVEFKSVDRVIPFDVLLNPGEYLAAAYPALGWIEAEQVRIKTIKKSIEISYDSMCAWLLRQCGSALAVVAEIEGGAQKAMDKVGVFRKMPARLMVPDCANSPVPFHKRLTTKIVRVAYRLFVPYSPDPMYKKTVRHYFDNLVLDRAFA